MTGREEIRRLNLAVDYVLFLHTTIHPNERHVPEDCVVCDLSRSVIKEVVEVPWRYQ